MHQTIKSTFSIFSIFFLPRLPSVLSRIFLALLFPPFLPSVLSLHHQLESYFICDKTVSLSSYIQEEFASPDGEQEERDFSSPDVEITPNFSRTDLINNVYTGEWDIWFFFFFFFVFASILFLSTVTYTYFIVKNACERSRVRRKG